MKYLLLTCTIVIGMLQGKAQVNTLDSFITAYVKKHDFAGSLLLSQKNKTLFQKSFGLANRPFSVINTNDTRYEIASVTKLFTAVLILQLAEEGKIDLRQTIGTYLPGYTGQGASRVTIHQLLNHTSGMRNRDTITSVASAVKNGMGYYQQHLDTDELLANYCSDTLVNEPGKVFSYNNGEYVILGKIIERLSNDTYEQVLRKKILQPLQMTNSGMARQDTIIAGLADRYFFRDDIQRLAPDLPVYIENWYASGAMYSTTGDLLKFARGLYGNVLLKQSSVDQLINPGLDDYGYSVWVYDSKFGGKLFKTIKRPGRIMGAQAQLIHYPTADLTVVILSNTGTTDLDDFAYQLSKRALK